MIKVLLLSANPQESRPLRVNQEFRRIYNNLSTFNNQFDIQMRPSATYDDLRNTLLSYQPSIIHFSCHGMGEQGLVLVDNNEKEDPIDIKSLGDLLGYCQSKNKNISCVIFNACYGEFQAQEINKHIKYTIGMRKEIKDENAICFAEVFYKILFSGETIETAFELGRNEIQRLDIKNNSNTVKRAIYDPASDDKIGTQPILDYQNLQLIVNEKLEEIYNSDLSWLKKSLSINFQQWDELYLILSRIDLFIQKNACRDTLKEDLQDIEPKILSVENLVGLKKLLLEKYPTHKKKDTLTILEFAERLSKDTSVSDNQKVEIKKWLEKVAQEKNISLPILPEKTKNEVQRLNSHLLISLTRNPEISETFSLEAELVFDYQEEKHDYESTTVTSQLAGINKFSMNKIDSFISDLIDQAIYKLHGQQFYLTIELFVPDDYLGENFDLLEISTEAEKSKRERRTLGSYKPPALGAKYPFTVRCLERYKHIEEYNQILNVWETDKFYLIEIIDELSFKSKDDYIENFYNFFDSGIPIYIWVRSCPDKLCDLDGKNYTQETVEKELKEIFHTKSLKNLSEIFERIHKLRKDAHDKKGDEAKKYLGYHLGFICDRPNIIPFNLRDPGLRGSN